jgi:hypothetical protein
LSKGYPSVLLNGPLSLVEKYWPCKPGLDEDGYPEVKAMIPESIRAAQIRIRTKKINKNRTQKPHLPEQRTRQSGKSCKVRASTPNIPLKYQTNWPKKAQNDNRPTRKKEKKNKCRKIPNFKKKYFLCLQLIKKPIIKINKERQNKLEKFFNFSKNKKKDIKILRKTNFKRK